MDDDIIIEKIKFETERYKLFFSSIVILVGGNISLVSRTKLTVWESIVLLFGIMMLIAMTFFVVKLDKTIKALIKETEG